MTSDNPQGKTADQAQLHDSIVRQLYRRSGATGQIQLPAVPGLIDEYVTMCDTLFAGVGRKFTAEELAHLKALMEDQLAQAYAASPRSMITISFNAPSSQLLNYHIKPEWWTIEGAYENWIGIRQPPFFGTEPDARVLALAGEAAGLQACFGCSMSVREPGVTPSAWPGAAIRSTRSS